MVARAICFSARATCYLVRAMTTIARAMLFSSARTLEIAIFHCLQRGRFCPEALCAAQYVLRVLLQNAQHAQHVQNANNTRITRRTRRTEF